jgi:hypothetical protein
VSHETGHSGPAFWVAVGVGVTAMAWGTWLFIGTTSRSGERFGLGLWIVLADVIVDWLVLPAIGLVGWLVSRHVPRWARPPTQVGLILSGTVLVLAWLPLHGTAESTGNQTIQPIDYPVAIATTLGVVWLIMALWTAGRWHAARA